jgi:oxygen-dependent protoporphyrinogen oxidase
LTVGAPRAAVVGAGLSGLTAAFRLQQAGWDVEVFESEPRIGGRTKTFRSHGYLVDTGASALGASYRAYLALAEELGLREEVVPSSPYIGIYRDGQIHLMRLDRMIRSGLSTTLLSWGAKLRLLRLGRDLLRAKTRGQLDYSDMRKSAPLDTETARAYALRVLDAELDSYLCEPVVRTMLIADTDKVSKVELFSGIANIFTAQIYALKGGQGRLAESLAERLEVAVNAPVERIREHGGQVEVQFRHDGRSTVRPYDACVVSAPLPVATEICPDHRAVLGPLNDGLTYTQCITVAIGTAVRPRTPAMLVQLPSNEDSDIALMFLDHNKAPDRAPNGHGLIGCCWETGAATKWMAESDEDIVAYTLASVRRVFPEIGDRVDFSHVTRWPRALPLTNIGAYRLIGNFNAALDPTSRIQFAADYMSAAGQNTAVEFGNRAAENLLTCQGRGNRTNPAPAEVRKHG